MPTLDNTLYLEQYEFCCTLSASSVSDVWLCTDSKPATNEDQSSVHRHRKTGVKSDKVVLKRTSFQHHDSGCVRSAFQCALTEVKILKLTAQYHNGHPNVIPYMGSFTHENSIYLVTPYFEGGDLYNLVQKHQRLDESLAIRIFADVASGLFYLHSLGYAHRDISMENVFLIHGNHRAVLGDFGLATDAIKVRHEILGKPYYIPPEVLHDAGYVDPKKGDMWSLGVMLFIMIFGFPVCLEATIKDPCFRFISQHGIERLLLKWRLLHCISGQTLCLLNSLLCLNPVKRGSFKQVVQHPVVAKYFKSVVMVD